MSEAKTLVCLANSRKEKERCIAGKLFSGGKAGEWIRPVSDSPKGEVPERDLFYGDGDPLRVTDIVTVPLLGPAPHKHQQENWLLAPESPLVNRGRLAWKQLGELLDIPADLWMDSSSDRSDRIAIDYAERMKNSLRFIYVDELTLSVNWPRRRPGMPFRKSLPQVRAVFEHHGNRYDLVVTDPVCESKYRDQKRGFGIQNKGGGEYAAGSCYVTVSLGEFWEGDEYCYKLAAAVIERQETQT